MKLNWALLCIDPNDTQDDDLAILHTCCYEYEPGIVDIDRLRAELLADEELGMVGVTDYVIVKINRIEHRGLFDYLELPEEIDADDE